MPEAMALQVTLYLNETTSGITGPLHMEILTYLHQENVYAATAMHCVAGFLGRQHVWKRRIWLRPEANCR